MWENLGHGEMIATLDWPEADPSWLTRETIEVAVQVNGKLRGTIALAPDSAKELAKKWHLPFLCSKILDGNTPKKVIVIPNRIVNVVV